MTRRIHLSNPEIALISAIGTGDRQWFDLKNDLRWNLSELTKLGNNLISKKLARLTDDGIALTPEGRECWDDIVKHPDLISVGRVYDFDGPSDTVFERINPQPLWEEEPVVDRHGVWGARYRTMNHSINGVDEMVMEQYVVAPQGRKPVCIEGVWHWAWESSKVGGMPVAFSSFAAPVPKALPRFNLTPYGDA